VNNFRFRGLPGGSHPFREIIGTITDAVYLRPHIASSYSFMRAAQRDPGCDRILGSAPRAHPREQPLGIEIDPRSSTRAVTASGRAERATLFPLASLQPGARHVR
jgi:hypothetical protein